MGTESTVMIGRGSKEDIRTRYLEGYVEKDGLDFIVWISLGKCFISSVIHRTVCPFLRSLQYPNIEHLWIHTH